MNKPRVEAPCSKTLWPLSDAGRLRRLALLSVIGMPALASAPSAQAAQSFQAHQWFNAARAAQMAPPAPRPVSTPGTPGTPGVPQPTLPNGVSSPDAAAARAARSMRSLQQSIQRIDTETQRQRAAASRGQLQAPAVPDGLTEGGLKPAVDSIAQVSNTDGCLNASQCLWVNADLPTQTVAQGRTTVEVAQSAEKAILTWESFNVGANTTLHIDQTRGTQTDGKNDWVALNRVKPGVQPSVVQGAIKAEGAVYVINQNGILFDAGSSIDTHSLIASTLPLYLPDGSQNLRQSTQAEIDYSNRLFLTSGPTSQNTGSALGSVLGLPQRTANAVLSIADEDALDAALPGAIEIAAGATLSVKDDGFGLIAAPNVRTEGVIQATDSQISVVAGIGVEVQRSSAPGSRYTVASSGRVTDQSQNDADITPVFSIDNDGLISSRRGGVSLVATRIQQDGVIAATTSVARQGFIDLQAKDVAFDRIRNGAVLFGADSLTTILPDDDNSKTNSSASANDQFKPLGVSVRGGAVVLDSGALIEAPGHSVDLVAVAGDGLTLDPGEGVAGRVYIAPGATIDVAGLADVAVPLSNVLITVPRLGLNELADSPLQRDGILFRSSIVFDAREFGTRDDGLQYVGTPLANLAGYVENIPRGVRELLTNGGNIRLVGNEVIADQRSTLNLAGGYLHYGDGLSNATRLITASGSIVSIADADPNVRYIGFAGRTIEAHPRWNVNRTFIDPVLSAGGSTVYEPQDIAGGRGGTLDVFGQSTSLIAADVDAHAVSGTRQVAGGRPTIGGTLQFGGNFASQIPLELNTAIAGPSYAIVNTLNPALLLGVNATSDPIERFDPADTADPGWWTPVSASMVSESGASVLRVIGDLPASAVPRGGEVRVVDGAAVSVAPGGNATGDNGVAISGALIELSGSRVAIDGQLTAPAGRISVTATGRTFFEGTTTEEEGPVPGDITVSGDSRLSVRGQFVNDNGLGRDRSTGGAYINGGSIALSTLQSSFVTDPGSPPVEPSEDDPDGDPGVPAFTANLTGAILLDPGSVLDVVSGARIAPNGRLQRTSDGVARGSGGSIALSTYVVNGTPFGRNANVPTPSELLDGTGRVEIGGQLEGFGFERGGRLAIRAPGILIDGGSGSDERGFLSLDPAVFSDNGFSQFRLDAVFDAEVAAGMAVDVGQRNFIAAAGADDESLPLARLATGSDLTDARFNDLLRIGRLDDLHRRGVRFELYSGDYLNWRGGESGGQIVPPDLSDPDLYPSPVFGTTLVGSGARVSADARSTIVLGSHNQVILLGEIVTHGGDVTLTADTAQGGYLNNPGVIVNPYTSDTKGVLLGAESRIDVSGTALFDTTSVPAGTSDIPIGDVISGGSVTLTADTGYVAALNCADTDDCAGSSVPVAGANKAGGPVPKFGDNTGGSGGGTGTGDNEEDEAARLAQGATIDLSGASGFVGILAPCPRIEEATQLFSDAGRLRIGAGSGLYFNGIIKAHAQGGAQGGSLTITPLNPLQTPENGYEGATRLVLAATTDPALTRDRNGVPLTTNPVPQLFVDFLNPPEVDKDMPPAAPAAPTGVLYFGADVLTDIRDASKQDSGIASLILGSDPALSKQPVPIDITQSLDIQLGRELQINTLLLSARPQVPVPPDTGNIKPIEVSLAAPYVAIHGYSEDIGVYNDFEDSVAFGAQAEVRQPLSTLSVDARILDLGGQMQIENFKDVAFTGRDEIRFLTPAQYSSFRVSSGEYVTLPGALLVGGNLDLAGGRIYPATGQTQILIADNHLRRSDLELFIRPTVKDEDGEPLSTLQTIYEASTARIRFLSVGSAADAGKPLSVGGRLIVSAADIEQNGALYAPGGQIQLGIASDEILEGVNADSEVFNYDLLPYFRSALPSVRLDAAYHYAENPAADDPAARRYAELANADPVNTAQTVQYDGPVTTQVGLETITRSVSFGENSITSVSLDGLTLPYGRTVDGLNLIYNGSGDNKAVVADLRQSPDKRVGAVGASVQIDGKATIDIRGGGDLIASEFVAGTGGSRDVLSTTNISFAGGTESLVPQYADGRDVYAILPGYSGVAPYDPEFTRRDPDGAFTGTQISATESTRAPLVGRAVYLSGVPGLAAGVYTLLPGAYATLPGAYRLVQDTRPGAQDVIATTTNQTLIDGTLQIAGQYVDQLTGARSTHATTFLVQPRAVWTRSSQYDFVSLNDYFNSVEAASNRALRAPGDGGTLALSALTRLTLDGDIRAAAPRGFNGPELQLSAPRLEITDGGTPASGFLSIDAARLNALGASRLVLGAVTGNSDDGVEEFYVGADNVVIANSAATPLRAGEIILVAGGEQNGDGVVLRQNAQLVATGTATGRTSPAISIGGEGTRQHLVVSPDADDRGALIDADEPDLVNIAGDGGLLQVSVNRPNTPQRLIVTGIDGVDGIANGRVTIGDGAQLSGAGSIGLDATGGVIVAPSARITTDAFSVSTRGITVADRDNAAGNGDLLIGPGLRVQLARINEIYLLGSEGIAFTGDATLRSRRLLELLTSELISDGGATTLESERVVLSNLLGGFGYGAGGDGRLAINATQIDLLGDRSTPGATFGFDGFDRVELRAGGAVIAAGKGQLAFGGADLLIETPLVAAAAGADLSLDGITQLGAFGAGAATPAVADFEGLGGSLSVQAASIDWNTVARTRAGSIRFDAGGDVRLGADAALDASGAVFTAYDRQLALSAGGIDLHSALGDVQLAAGSELAVSAGAAGGDAGRIALRSDSAAVVIDGDLRGSRVGTGDGAQLAVDSRDALDLNRLADIVSRGGIDGSVALRSGAGDLQLSSGRTLSADALHVVADGGSVAIDGRLDAAGATGGDIALYGRRGVAIGGSLLANAEVAGASGGHIAIGTGAAESTATDATYGYRAVSAIEAGRIDIRDGALLDVSGHDGGITLRAPVLADHRVPVTVAGGATIRGAASPELEIVARWDAGDASSGAQHFSGVIDPSGSLDGSPASDSARFITETLAGYVRTPGWQIDAALGQAAGWARRAGVELSSDSDIRVASDWNLAAGNLDAAGHPVLSFRTNGLAPAISLRAGGDVLVAASISDGFFQTVNPFNPLAPTTDVDNSLAPVATAGNPLPLATASLLGLQNGKPYDSSSLRIVAGADTGSADPLALAALAVGNRGSVVLSGHQSAVSNAPGNEGRLLLTPTMIRTGVGSIDVVAAQDIRITDVDAPGVIVAAGHAGIAGVVRPNQTALQPVTDGKAPVLDTGNVQPRDAGDIRLSAGRDIVSIASVTDGDGSRTGVAGTDLTQFWWPWMQASCVTTVVACGPQDSASINFGMFDQGVLSSGGDVRLEAGRDLRQVSVSMPTTWTRADGVRQNAIGGGGVLDVRAGGDINGGSYFVSTGEGSLRALGAIAGPILALQDARLSAEAAQGLSVGGAFNPSYLFTDFDSNAYSAASAVRLVTAAGDANFGAAAVLPGSRYGFVPGVSVSAVQTGVPFVLPAHLSIAAASGTLTLSRGGELFPSADGQLELLAQGSINLQGASNSGERLGLIDAVASSLPSIDNPLTPSQVPAAGSYIDGASANFLLRDPALLHAHDVEPVRIYSVGGSLLNGYQPLNLATAADPDAVPEYVSSGINGLRLLIDKPASLRAGLDIVNLYFSGQNFYASDVTTIAASRDILDPVLQPTRFVPLIELGGPGTLAVSAGRNLGPITAADDVRDAGYLNKGNEQFPGIRTIGNNNNLYLDRSGAGISVAFGVGPGINLDEFAETYINPAVNHDPLDRSDALGTPDYSAQLVAYVRQQLTDAQRRDGTDRSSQIAALDPARAWQVFGGLPIAQRQKFVGTVFLDVLNQVGLDYNQVERNVVDRAHPGGVQYTADNIRFAGQYGRGFQAIESLFPSDQGYTQNALDGSRNGALISRSTGNLDIRGSTIQTRFGGDIDILGPGGSVLIGSSSAPPFTAETSNTAAVGPSSQGILALQTGAVRLFADQSIQLAQSRVFTLQGGELLIWSSNGDVNAGKGAKTSSEVPPLTFSCDDDLFCVVNTQSQVSGAGIAALQTDPSKPPGSANLIAPVGTVDAGDAGIRVSGSLNVAAFQVANADNIAVGGESVGVPTGATDTAAVSVANSVAAAVSSAADQAASNQTKREGELELFVEILTPASKAECDPKKPADCL